MPSAALFFFGHCTTRSDNKHGTKLHDLQDLNHIAKYVLPPLQQVSHRLVSKTDILQLLSPIYKICQSYISDIWYKKLITIQKPVRVPCLVCKSNIIIQQLYHM